jgi:hypothetical protein
MRNKSVREHRIVCSIPAIRLASDGGRLLFIQWERPAPLEEFLLPPGKLDWRLPVWLDEQLNMHNMTKFTLSDKTRIDSIRLHRRSLPSRQSGERLLPGQAVTG